MNRGKKDSELIKQMAESLRNHTEPYREGAWERFSAMYGKPKPALWTRWYWGAAAVLLLAAGWFLLGVRQERAEPAFVHTETVYPEARVQEPQRKPEVQPLAVDEESPAVAQHSVPRKRKASPRQERASVHKQQEVASDPSAAGPVVMLNTAVSDEDDSRRQPERETLPAPQAASPAGEERPGLLAQRTPHEQAIPVEAGKNIIAKENSNVAGKWDLGLVVSPSLTTERVNMGGGIAVAYQLSDRLSLRSGVSLGELGVGQSHNRGRGNLSAMLDSQTPSPPNDYFQGWVQDAPRNGEITSVTSNILALDIPLDVRYHVTRGFYASVGVSFLTVLEEQRTNHLVINRINEETFGNAKNSERQGFVGEVQPVYLSERAASRPLEGRGYTGFMNFSIGRTMPLTRKLSLSVEPYFKLPVGRLSREDMDFTNGGIRIVTGF
ncbi:hypothetical protein SAMN05421747_10560 [Parapedobacter composti]|uniref:Outer membrane protein beta-barrel domain-containing protein n=1 Tax=Parapedobacter composti TaxID=623281 RepID=A0A1I1GSH4_9SPHI|nr:hypothetical protein [Parapedobacter composti]SFC14425.1 hypothetical protein SAMN05421747_10560 [Parapedobacter composti]